MSNVDTARSAYEAFGRGDLDALQEWFAEDAVWVTSDELPLGGEVKGRDADPGELRPDPQLLDLVQRRARGVHRLPATRSSSGAPRRAGNDKGSFEAPFVHLLKYDENGKTVRGEFFTDSAKAAKLLS